MSDTVPFTEAKAHLSAIVDRVARERARVTVTKNGRPSAVIMNPDELESLEETLEILSDKELVASVRKSRKELAQGKTHELRKRFPPGKGHR